MTSSGFKKPVAGLALVALLAALLLPGLASADVAHYRYRIVQNLPHDPHSFTQGLVVDGDDLIESSGLYGRSFIRRYRRANGATVATTALPGKLFGEGVTTLDQQLYCLTWKAGQVLRFSKDDLSYQATLKYRGEGWGLATLDGLLLMSDGSDKLSLRDPATFKIVRTLKVRYAGKPVIHLNDLTVSPGLIWVNVWLQTRVLGIDSRSGVVVAELDLSALAQAETRRNPDNVLNGLAWDAELNGLWVTGKRWQRRYLLELVAPQ